jgi:quinol monooxygenase YgiN
MLAVADLYGISGRRAELISLLERSERAAAGGPGCRRYTFAATVSDPDRFVLVSEWDSPEAMDAHYRSQAFAEFQFGLEGLLARPSVLTVYAGEQAVRPLDSGQMDPRDAD